VTFIREDDEQSTIHDTETGIASSGESKAEALRMLAEGLELHEGTESPTTEKVQFVPAHMKFEDEIPV